LHYRLSVHVDSQEVRANRGFRFLQQNWLGVGREKVREPDIITTRELAKGVD